MVLRQVVRIVCQILYRISRVYLACNAWLLILPMANMYTMISMLWAVDIAYVHLPLVTLLANGPAGVLARDRRWHT